MSRIMVRGLRKSTTEKDLTEAFAKRGDVTDVKVMKTKAGKSRQFAFVGFRTNEQATDCCNFFNNTFIDSAKVSIEMAKRVGDEDLSSEKKRRAERAKEKAASKVGHGEKQQQQADDATRSKERGNATLSAKSAISQEKADFLEVAKGRSKAHQSQSMPVVRGRSANTEAVSSDDEGDDDDDSGSDEEDVNDFTTNQQTSSKSHEPLSDLDYLRSKTVTLFSSDEEDDDGGDAAHSDSDLDGDSNIDEEGTKSEVAHNAEDDIMDARESEEEGVESDEDVSESESGQGRLFVRNLPYSCTEDELREVFAPFGHIDSIHLPLNSDSGGGRGFGFVQYVLPENAANAKIELDGCSFQGRVIHVLHAKQNNDENSAVILDAHGKPLSEYQTKKELERRANAGRTTGWNASFVRSEVVVESIAQRYGLKESDVLDTSHAGGDMAIRLAVGEAQVIQENRDFFREKGVNIESLESQSSDSKASSRSNTTFLIKNLPKDTNVIDLEAMFAKYGMLVSFLIAPSKTVALADYLEPTHARAAFKGLAYRRFQQMPIYLEWAPKDIIDKKTREKSIKDKSSSKKSDDSGPGATTKGTSESTSTKSDDGELLEEDQEAYQTLFLKNLAFSVTEEALQAHLESLDCGRVRGLRAVNIPVKTKGANTLSVGYGFAEYTTAKDASVAIQRLNNSVLEGHRMEVKMSDKKLSSSSRRKEKTSAPKPSDKTSCKIIIRNIAFQATQNELKSLCSTFGSVKKVRIPKKMDGTHRGFSFVDFTTHREAAAAADALMGAHFYGRRLVIEWAKDDGETLNSLRKRAGADDAAIKYNNLKKQRTEPEAADEELM
eukprot:GSChrysophyteH1.ASY1.ANO1.185.1 assembled CDS